MASNFHFQIEPRRLINMKTPMGALVQCSQVPSPQADTKESEPWAMGVIDWIQKHVRIGYFCWFSFLNFCPDFWGAQNLIHDLWANGGYQLYSNCSFTYSEMKQWQFFAKDDKICQVCGYVKHNHCSDVENSYGIVNIALTFGSCPLLFGSGFDTGTLTEPRSVRLKR